MFTRSSIVAMVAAVSTAQTTTNTVDTTVDTNIAPWKEFLNTQKPAIAMMLQQEINDITWREAMTVLDASDGEISWTEVTNWFK